MKELVARVQVFNNRLRERRMMLGLTPRALAEKVGIGYQGYLNLEALRTSPYPKRFNGRVWSKVARKLAEFHGTTEEELFPGAVLTVRQRVVERQFDAEEAFALMGGGSEVPLLPDAQVEARERAAGVRRMLQTLTRREQDVLEKRFGFTLGGKNIRADGMTLDEIAVDYELQRERIRQIEAKALRKLCRQSRSRLLRQFVDPDRPS